VIRVRLLETSNLPPCSAMDENRYFVMREHLDRLTAEHERSDAVAPMRGHDDKIAAFRLGGTDDRMVGMLVLALGRVEHDTSRSCRVDGCAERCSGVGRYARLGLSRRVRNHMPIGREDMKRGVTIRNVILAPMLLASPPRQD
jgi:hypothetical protein